MPKLIDFFTKKAHLDFLVQLGFSLEADLEDCHPKTNNFLLHEVIMANHASVQVSIVRALLKREHGVDVNRINIHSDSIESNGHTPLTLAISRESFLLCQLLVQEGADLEKVNEFGCSPLMEAA